MCRYAWSVSGSPVIPTTMAATMMGMAGPLGRCPLITSPPMTRGLNNETLSDRLNAMGVETSRYSVKRMRAGDKKVNVDDLFALALALETTVENLLYPHRIARTYDKTPERTQGHGVTLSTDGA
jgi:hypothetical protein